ncbi:MAG: hypothetical protein ACI96N_000143 [Arenicella sp.]|jgi:hypothetical protein
MQAAYQMLSHFLNLALRSGLSALKIRALNFDYDYDLARLIPRDAAALATYLLVCIQPATSSSDLL